MTNKPVYHMSGIGDCPRVLAAYRLGGEPTPSTPQDEERLKYYTRCEDLAAAQITDLGYKLVPSSLCQTCKDQYGIERHGIHVEVNTTLFTLIGHLDRRIILDKNYPVEIKSLGRFAWTRFQKDQFKTFSNYAGQECAYLEAEQKPGIYWVMNRDTGEALKYIINDFNNELNLEGFEKITLPITFIEIVNKLNDVEIFVQDNVLPEGIESENCRYCKFKYLCIKAEEEEKPVEEVTLPSLQEAADMYKSALDMEKVVKEEKELAKDALLLHSKQNKLDKYQVSGLSVSYRGQKVKKWLDEKIIRQEAPAELVRLAERESKPFDDYSIRSIRE